MQINAVFLSFYSSKKKNVFNMFALKFILDLAIFGFQNCSAD